MHVGGPNVHDNTSDLTPLMTIGGNAKISLFFFDNQQNIFITQNQN